MNIFYLPDLGEGLPDAEIHEWFVKEGDIVVLDQPLVSMETAKAIVEIPAPQSGIIEKRFGNPGDLIKTKAPLIAFMDAIPTDTGTVVGKLEENQEVPPDIFIIKENPTPLQKSTPFARALAKKIGVDLQTLHLDDPFHVITKEVVMKAHQKQQDSLPQEHKVLRGVRRAMLQSMQQSHQEVVPVSLFDEADINSWSSQEDITVRVIEALLYACQKEPSLNAWFHKEKSAVKVFSEVHLGLAMDTEDGLFVPVIHHALQYNRAALRQKINAFKASVSTRIIPQEALKGATITLSNFGKFAGRFASPIIVPPTVAILAVGRQYEGAVAVAGSIFARPLLPLSLSFDHRAVTGGEASRFLGALMEHLQN